MNIPIIHIPSAEYHAASRSGRYMSSHLLAAFRESPELYRRKTNGEIAEGESPALAAQPSTAPGWRFMATPDAQQAGTRWFWKDGQFTTEPPAQPDWQGVWYYPDTNP